MPAMPAMPAMPPVPVEVATSHREAKKRRTRDAIVGAAQRLFAEQGYARTTVAQIAREAGVSPRTVFSYVESKEALLFDWLTEPLDRLETSLRQRPRDVEALTAFRSWMLHDYHQVAARHAAAITDDLLDGDAPVAAHALRIQDRVQSWLRDALAADLRCPPTSSAATLAAAAIVGALAYGPTPGDSPADRRAFEQFVDEAITFVRHGLAAMGHPSAVTDPGSP